MKKKLSEKNYDDIFAVCSDRVERLGNATWHKSESETKLWNYTLKEFKIYILGGQVLGSLPLL